MRFFFNRFGKDSQFQTLYNSSFIIYNSPLNYVYCANNPVMLVDPDGRETELTLDDNGFITNMIYIPGNPLVYLNFNGETLCAGLEPPQESYFFEKIKIDNKIQFKIVADSYQFDFENWNTELKFDVTFAMKTRKYNIDDVKLWGPGRPFDFKSDHKEKVGIAWNTVMTSRDTGNANWGAYLALRYSGNSFFLSIISNGTQILTDLSLEDKLSFSMQKWGQSINFYQNMKK